MHAFAISLAIAVMTEAKLEAQIAAYPSREVIMTEVYFALDYRINLGKEEAKTNRKTAVRTAESLPFCGTQAVRKCGASHTRIGHR